MIPTVIEFFLIFLLVIAFIPFVLIGLSFIPFLHIEVNGYLASAGYLGISTIIGILFSLLLIWLTKKQLPIPLFWLLRFVFSFLSYFVADELMTSVTIPLYVELGFALFTNLSSVNELSRTINGKPNDVKPDKPNDKNLRK